MLHLYVIDFQCRFKYKDLQEHYITVTLKNGKARKQMKPRRTCIRMMGGETCGEGKKQLMVRSIWWDQCYGMDMYGCCGTQSLVFIDDVTADRSKRMNSLVYKPECNTSYI